MLKNAYKNRTVLLVEDSRLYAKVIQKQLFGTYGIHVNWAKTLSEAKGLVESPEHDHDLALLDLTLPDAPDGEIVPFCIYNNIPSVVFTGTYNSKLRGELFQAGVIDYVIKDSPIAVDYLVGLVTRLLRNKEISVIIASKDADVRNAQREFIENLQFTIYEAKSSIEARKLLFDHPEISIAFVGENLWDTSGLDLAKAFRKHYPASKLSIIALPGENRELASQFIKYGANDYVLEPTTPEEFYCRVNNAIETKEQLRSLEYAANHDFMTGLLNRRAFFDRASVLVAQAARDQISITVAMLDIDKFKLINDTYGHDIGDEAIIALADCVSSKVRGTDMTARFGGEEFALIMVNISPEDQRTYFDKLRLAIADIRVPVPDGAPIKFTASIGVSNIFNESLDTMLTNADNNLYTAKEGGRNRVEYDPITKD